MLSESHEQESNPLLGIIRFVRAVRERKIIPILCVGVFCLAGIIYYAVTPEIYEARSDVLLNGNNNRDVLLLTSEPVLSNVVQELADEKIPELKVLPISLRVSYLRNHLSVKSPGGRPDILNLRYASHDPQAATVILNKLVATYVSYLNHKLFQSIEMGNYRARIHQRLSKNVSILLKDNSESGVHPPGSQKTQTGNSREIQKTLSTAKFPSDQIAPEAKPGTDLTPIKRSAEPAVEISLAPDELQKEPDQRKNGLHEFSESDSADASSTRRQKALEEFMFNLDILNKSQNIRKTIILSQAIVPTELASPRKLTTILPVLVFLGFGLGLGIIYVVNAVDDRFHLPSELCRRMGLPLLETIPKETQLGRFLPNRTGRHYSLKEVELKEFEALRVTLDLLGEKSNVLAISSVDSQAGKTTVSAGLASAYARCGKRTLLIDADYQNGKLSRLFSDGNEAGLSRILSDEIPFSDAAEENVLCISDRGLEFLPRGKMNDSSTNLLTTKRFSEFISWCETHYDQIVIDTPAALDSCNASILGEAADGIILVVTPDSTSRSRTLRACCNLKTLGCRLIGVVANQLDPHSPWLTKEGYGYVGVDSQTNLHNTPDQVLHAPRPQDDLRLSVEIEKHSDTSSQDTISSINKTRAA